MWGEAESWALRRALCVAADSLDRLEPGERTSIELKLRGLIGAAARMLEDEVDARGWS